MKTHEIHPRTSEGREGFTLIELLVVVTMIGLLAGIMVPRIDFQRARVDSAAFQLSSNLLLAQRIAVMRQHDVRISFDADELDVIIHEDGNNDGDVDSGEETRVEALGDGVGFDRVGTQVWGPGDAITFEEGDEGFPTLTFHRNGSASAEGAIHLTTLPRVNQGEDRAIRITRATGLARCWNRRTGTWREGC
jgi:prepilin-type N-terminal cleavage/methylation domain-containing protein